MAVFPHRLGEDFQPIPAPTHFTLCETHRLSQPQAGQGNLIDRWKEEGFMKLAYWRDNLTENSPLRMRSPRLSA